MYRIHTLLRASESARKCDRSFQVSMNSGEHFSNNIVCAIVFPVSFSLMESPEARGRLVYYANVHFNLNSALFVAFFIISSPSDSRTLAEYRSSLQIRGLHSFLQAIELNVHGDRHN